jgi:hypothetical protein
MKTIQFLLAILMALTLFSCSDDAEPQPTIDHHLLSEATTTSGKKIKLWSEKGTLSVAFNKIYISVQTLDSAFTGEPVLSILPVMDMGTMKHASPAEQPVYNASTKLYEAGVVFSMPSGSKGSWQLVTKIGPEEVIFNVSVAAAANGTKYTTTFLGKDGVSYSLSLAEPQQPKIGINDLEILVNRRENMMWFPVVSDLTIEVTPEMPSMNHGSPNNVNPVFDSKGRYIGKVNFTMTGDWRLHFKISKGSTIIAEDVALDLVF